MKKKKVDKKKGSNKRNVGMLREALVDIDREIASLNKKKQELKKTETKRSKDVSILIAREAGLRAKKKEIESKQEKILSRLSKIKKVKYELKEI